MIFMLCFFMIFLLMTLFLVLSIKVMNFSEEMTSYECGFDPITKTRLEFSYRFFLLSILFLIFDIEIVLMIFIPYFILNIKMIITFNLFLVILLMGLLYEYMCGVLMWFNIISKA